MESAMDSQSQAEPEEPKNEKEDEDENLVSKVHELMSKITSSPENPSPKVLHALASILETQESRYMEELSLSSPNNGRASHNIGRLVNLIRDNDEFFELISSDFLSRARYSTSIRSAATRLLISCATALVYPHVFEDAVLENIKNWVMDDSAKFATEGHSGMHDSGKNMPTDSEMLGTYATGLLAVCLAAGGQLVEDVLTSGLSAKLMRYLRMRVLGETNTIQKDGSYQTEGKNTSGATCTRGREENRGRIRHALDGTNLDGHRIGHEGLLDDLCINRDHGKGINIRQVCVEECWGDVGQPQKSLAGADLAKDGLYEVENAVEQIGEESWHRLALHDGKEKFSDSYGTSRFVRDEDDDENARDDSSRRRANRGWTKNRGKGRINGGAVENESALASPISGLRLGAHGRNIRDRHLSRNEDTKKLLDARKYSSQTDADGFAIENENNDCFQEFKVGTRDISDLVKTATRAAEAEARAVNAPVEAIKAAADAAAELVKSAALEMLQSTNDEEAAVLAASEAASTVVDAASATEVSRCASNVNEDSMTSRAIELGIDEETEGFFILDSDSLAQLREKYCIQCLEVLGEYVEVLGPVLHEKGVDVCLSLLKRSSKHEVSKFMVLLPDVLKLICALAAHRKFASLFVDHGGMQKLLAVPRVTHTFFGLSSCLFTIGSLQVIMERVCALPSDVVHKIVELALQLLECPQDLARKNAAVFFASAFMFRGVVDSFDAQVGLKKLLNLLHSAALVRSGGNSGTLGLSDLGSLRNDQSPAEVLTASEKQVAYHTCVALRQYFRAHLLLLVESVRPNKNNRSVGRNIPSARAAYKPLDISNETIDALIIQIQRDRKLGPAVVRTRWPAVDMFLGSNGHITMLELCQAPNVERYLHDLAQYALGVLHIVTLVPYSRKLIVNATLSNDRVGMAVILDTINGAGYVDPEVIQPALHVLVNLVCPPPSISNKPPVFAQGQQAVSFLSSNGPAMEARERHVEGNILDQTVLLSVQNEFRERNGESSAVERSTSTVLGASSLTSSSQTIVPTITSGVVGDRRISLGPGSGCAGLAAQLEQGYHQAREAVRINNGIKVLLRLLHPRALTPGALDCIRALSCRVLLGLARDETIAHILTKLQVGKKLSELIRDSSSPTYGSEQSRWQSELTQVAIELISTITNSGRATTLAATDAAAPTLRRIERAAIAAATPITYHSRELLLLIHEHLQASGLATTAAALLKEAQLTPLPYLAAPLHLLHQNSVQKTTSMQFQWPSGRAPHGFLADARKLTAQGVDTSLKSDSVMSSKKTLVSFTSNLSFKLRNQSLSHPTSVNKISSASKSPSASSALPETPVFEPKPNSDIEPQIRTPIVLPMKRKMEFKDTGFTSPRKRLATPSTVCKSNLPVDAIGFSVTPNSIQQDRYGQSVSSGIVSDNLDDSQYSSTPARQMIPASFHLSLQPELQHGNPERVTLDSLVVQYLKHQHRQCPAPITTLPPLSLLHPHVCPEARRSLDLPANVTSRLSTREFRNQYGGIHGNRRDRQFVYSRFRPWRTCRDDSDLLTCISFLRGSSQIVTGSHSGELKIFDSNSGNILESHTGHQSPLTLVQSVLSSGTQLVLTSGSNDIRLWDASSVSAGPMHPFEGCRAGQFSNSGTMFAAISTEASQRDVLLYDVQTFNLELKLSDTSTGSSGLGRGHVQSLVHFSPSDTLLLWNGVLWDRRGSGPVHRFDQFTDYGGGGFHPAGNEVIINSEVWDLRKFKLLRSVPSLDQTVIKFNSYGDVIYAILRRNLEDITSVVNARRMRHPLFSAFRTVDAVNYTDIATVPVDRCVLDFATEPTDSFVGLVSMDDHDEMFASARLYEIGRRRPTDDDSDPDDAESEEEEDEDDSEAGEDPIFGSDLDGDVASDADDMSNDDDDNDSVDEVDNDDDGDFAMDGTDFDGGMRMFEIVAEGVEDDDNSQVESFSSGDEGDYPGNGFDF